MSAHSNWFIRLIENHWKVDHKEKSEKQEQRERQLCLYIPGIPFTRWILFLAAFLIQFCCGSLYAWSVYNKPIDTYVFGDPLAGKSVETFYIAVGMFGLTTAIMGPWLERHGPRNGLMLGSTVFGIGNAIVAISLNYRSIIGVYIGYGVFVGFGLGLNYISPVSALQKYFPDYRGIAAGFAVGGFGAGSVVWAQVILPLIALVGLPATFGILGSIMTGTMLICAIAMRTPPNLFAVHGLDIEGASVGSSKPSYNKDKLADDDIASSVNINRGRTTSPKLTLIESILTLDFLFMYLMFFSNELFGLVVLSRLSSMAQDIFKKTPAEGSTIVSINGIFNCCGRLLLPLLSDVAIHLTSRVRSNVNPSFVRKCVFVCTLSCQTAILASLPTIINNLNYDAFRAVMWILTVMYGGGFGTIPVFLTDMFGPYNIGALHGIILTAWSIGGVAGGLGFTENYNKLLAAGTPIPQCYIQNFYWILGICVAGFISVAFVRTSRRDRALPGWRFTVFKFELWHIGAQGL